MTKQNRLCLFCVVLGSVLFFVRPLHADLLVSSLATHSILRYTDDGDFIEAFVPGQAGSTPGPLLYPGGMAVGPDGNLYVASRGNSSVLRYEWPTGNFLGSFTLGGGLGLIPDIVFGLDDNLYVGSDGGVKKFDGSTGQYLGDFVPEAEALTYLTFGPDGNLYGSTPNNIGVVNRYDGGDGSFIDEFVTSSAAENSKPGGLARIFHPLV